MNDASTMRMIECSNDLEGDSVYLWKSERTCRNELRQSLAFQILEHEEVDVLGTPKVE
jgi:hypothetical protein